MKTKEIALKDYKGHRVSLLRQWKMHAYNIQLFPIRKPLNILHSLYSWKIRKTNLKSHPAVIRLNTSAICNLRCIPCCSTKKSFNLKEGQSREKYLMSTEMFKSVLSQTGHKAQRMTFHITGEPMMNKNLFEMVKMASEQNISTYFSTNYNLMTPELLPKLFDSGLHKIRIGFDGFSQEAYSKYRMGGDVEKLKQAIIMTMNEKKRRKVSYPIVEVQIITFYHVQPEIDQIKNFCREHGVDRIFSLPDGCNFDGSHEKVVEAKPFTSCFWPWLSMVLDSNGDIYSCGQDFEDLIPYGNIKTDSIESIWNNELYHETRKFLSGKSKKRDDLKINCYNCPAKFGQKGKILLSDHEIYLSKMREN